MFSLTFAQTVVIIALFALFIAAVIYMVRQHRYSEKSVSKSDMTRLNQEIDLMAAENRRQFRRAELGLALSKIHSN